MGLHTARVLHELLQDADEASPSTLRNLLKHINKISFTKLLQKLSPNKI